jgi:cytochrome b561
MRRTVKACYGGTRRSIGADTIGCMRYAPGGTLQYKVLANHLARRWHVAAIEAVDSQTRAAGARRLSFVLPLYALGIAGLMRDARLGALYLPRVNLHGIFGAMLWLLVVAQFRQASLAGAALNGAGVHEISRGLSRRVYLLLYVLFGASYFIRIAAIIWNRGTLGALHPAMLTSPENLRDYLAYGVFALLTIRVLAAMQCQALKRVAAR